MYIQFTGVHSTHCPLLLPVDSYGIFGTWFIRQELVIQIMVPLIEKDHAYLENQALGRKLLDSNLAIHQT